MRGSNKKIINPNPNFIPPAASASKPIIKLKFCKYRALGRTDYYCCKDISNCTGDVEPCDFCNMDFEEYEVKTNE